MFPVTLFPEKPKIKIGISSCLLGIKVRFDGGHKLDRYINDELKPYFEFCPVCPEADSGLGAPREPVRLLRRDDGTIRAAEVNNPGLDVTDKLSAFGQSRLPGLAALRGYIVKSRSPSCGMDNVPVYSGRGELIGAGRGIFTSALISQFRLLPVIEESGLYDSVLRDNFLERVLIYDRWRSLLESGLTVAKLVDFHDRHKGLVFARDRADCQRLHRMVLTVSAGNLDASAEAYGAGLMNALKHPANRKKPLDTP